MKKEWWKKSVVYQIYPRSFMDSNGDGIGDIQGIIQKLDYLQKLGVDVLWLSPIFDSPNDDNGYDIRNYEKIMNEFGTMADFDELLEEAHKRNLKIMLDLVVNHTSDEHEWFENAKSSKDNPMRDFYIWKEGKDGELPNNWGSFFSGPAWEYNEATEDYFLHLFSKKQPDLNWECKELREKVYEMMRFWLDKGIDGFRMDVINLISKEESYEDGFVHNGSSFGDGSPYYMNGPKIHDYLHEMNESVLSHYDIMTVGEMPGVTTEEAKLYTNEERKELQMVFTFEHMGLDSLGEKWDLKPLSLIDLKDNLTKWQTELYNTGWNSLYWNNHDQPRIVSRFGNDQEMRVASAKMLATCLHMMQGTPYIYQGEEIGMTNVKFSSIEEYEDLETINMYNERINKGYSEEEIMNSIYVKGRDNARTPIQWSSEENGGFTTGTPWLQVNPRYKEINVENALSDEQSIFYHYQKLISLRKKVDVITDGKFELLHRNHPSVFVYTREDDNEKLFVLCNFSNETVVLEDDALLNNVGKSSILITNVSNPIKEEIKLMPYEATVYYLKK